MAGLHESFLINSTFGPQRGGKTWQPGPLDVPTMRTWADRSWNVPVSGLAMCVRCRLDRPQDSMRKQMNPGVNLRAGTAVLGLRSSTRPSSILGPTARLNT